MSDFTAAEHHSGGRRLSVRRSIALCAAAVAVVIAAAVFYYPPPDQAAYHPAAAGQPFAEGKAGLVNLNTAGLEELTVLPGIGEKKAAAIIKRREEAGPFTQLEDLLQVSGVGPKILEGLKGLVTW